MPAIDQLDVYLEQVLDHPVPRHTNPPDHAIDLVNTDFLLDAAERSGRIVQYSEKWNTYAANHGWLPTSNSPNVVPGGRYAGSTAWLSMFSVCTKATYVGKERGGFMNAFRVSVSRTYILMRRNMLNYNRNLLAYGVRFGMYRE